MTMSRNETLLTGVNTRAFFQDALQSAMSNQHITAKDETVVYLVNLLTLFVRSENVFEPGVEGRSHKPLALIYAEALDASSVGDRDHALKKLGDLALFISGLYANSLARSLVDVDYYIQMGGNAYGFLSESNRVARETLAFKIVYLELAGHFTAFVDILSEVGEQTHLNNSTDIMRLYEIWLATGNQRAADKLQKLGIQPVKTQRYTH